MARSSEGSLPRRPLRIRRARLHRGSLHLAVLEPHAPGDLVCHIAQFHVSSMPSSSLTQLWRTVTTGRRTGRVSRARCARARWGLS